VPHTPANVGPDSIHAFFWQVELLGALTSTDRDESHNKTVKKVCRSVRVGAARLLPKMALLQRLRAGLI